VKAAGVILGVSLALVLQTTLARFVVRGTFAVDLVLVAVVYVALTSGPVAGLLSGTVAGLMQDALSSGVIGIGGLSKTVVGFLTGIIGTQFIVTHSLPRFVVFLAATVLHAIVFMGLYVLLDLRPFGMPYAAVGGQALGNAVVGIIVFQIVELLPGAVERRRAQRGRLRR
jgi:rod shape-determining protein MreD